MDFQKYNLSSSQILDKYECISQNLFQVKKIVDLQQQRIEQKKRDAGKIKLKSPNQAWRYIQQTRQSLEERVQEIRFLKSQIQHIMYKNYEYQQNFIQVNNVLEQLIRKIVFNFFDRFQKEQKQSFDLQVDSVMKSISQRLQQIKICLEKAQNQMNQRKQIIKADYQSWNEIKQRELERASAYRDYIDKLREHGDKQKQKIKLLQSQIDKIKSTNKKNKELLQDMDKIQMKLDLRYTNRNNLISMIKCLTFKMKKHENHCHEMQKQLNTFRQEGTPAVVNIVKQKQIQTNTQL